MVEYLSGGRLQGSSTALLTPTYSDSNFGSWTTTGSEVTESSDVISFSITTRYANNGVSVDLGSTLSSTQWVMRFKINFSTLSYSGSSSMLYFMAGLSSASSATGLSNSGIGQDFIGLQKRLETGGGSAEGWGVVAYSNSGGFDNPESSQFTNPASTTGGDGSGNYWVEIIRYMDGSDNKMSIELFSDSSYSTSIQKISKTINVDSTDALQYVLITNGHGVSTTSGTTIGGSVRDIQVWNNTTVAIEDEKTTLTNVPANSRYEEIDTRKIFRRAILKDNCIAYYNFDSTTGGLVNQATTTNGFTDGLGSAVDGTVSGATLDTTNEKLGTGCYDFDGTNDYVNLGTNSGLNLLNGGTVTMWVNTDNITDKRFAGKGSNGAWELLSETTDNKVKFRVNDGTVKNVVGTTALSDGTWYHVGAVYDKSAGEIKIYINGTLEATTSSIGQIATISTATYFGRNEGGNYYDGKIDDTGIWNVALSGDQISALYNSGTGRTVNTAGVWKERNSA